MSIEDLFNKVAVVYRKSESSTNSFGEKGFVLVEQSSFPCALQPSKEELIFHVGGKEYIATEILYCLPGVNIQASDIVKIDGVDYIVLSVTDDGGRGHHLKCFLKGEK